MYIEIAGEMEGGSLRIMSRAPMPNFPNKSCLHEEADYL